MARSMWRGSAWGSLLGIVLFASAGAALAQDRIDVARGHGLARAWCADCHGVEPGEISEPYEIPPSFRSFARNPEVTETALKAYLQSTHPIMPQVKLSGDEIDEIVAYILSLKDK